VNTVSKAIFVLVLIASAQPALWAQSLRGSIGGLVSDSSGRPVAGAAVQLSELATGRHRQTISDTAGGFTITLLPPGAYRLEVSSDGFRTYVRDIELEVNQEIRVAVDIQPGVRTNQVQVTASREVLRTESPALGAVVDNMQVTGLPLDGRNFLELSLLLPGAAPAAPGSAGSVRGDLAVNVNGAREDANHYLLDGVYNGDPKLNNYAVNPPVDAVREFEVLTSTYDASFGRNAGGQVNVVLRSGSNQFHGAAYEFFRHSAFSGRNFFAPAGEADPTYRRNQFGAALGGPVIRNRTFFFGDYEGRRVLEGVTRITNVPSAAERQGDFSQSGPQAAPIDPLTGLPFPGSVIPSQRIHPVGRNLANLYPLPDRSAPNQNFVSSPELDDRDDRFDLRLDHALSAKSELTGRYSFGDRTLFEPLAGVAYSAVPGYGNLLPRRAQNVMAGETHAFSPVVLNELRLAYNRVAFGVFPQNSGNSINRAVGLPELSSNPRDYGLSLISVTGFSSLGDESNNPQQSVTNTYQLIDNLTWSRGRHLAKFGFEARILQQNAYRDVQSRGFINFLGLSGNALAEMLQGFISVSGGAVLDNPQHLRTHSLGLFVTDSWRIRRNLTVSAGLRYEFNAPPVDAFDRATIYDPASGTLAPVGAGGMPRSGFFPDRNNWAPRLGFSWQPGADTVIRAAYGIYYDLSSLAPGEGLYFNQPYFNFRLYFPLPELRYYLTLSDPFPASFPVPLPSSALTIQRDLRTGYLQQWNFSVQRQFGRNRVLEAAYVGSKGSRLLAGRDINQPLPNPQPLNLRPNPRFDDITALESRGSSAYHSLQLRLQQRLQAGLSLLGSYTYGKSIDNASSFFTSSGDANFPQDSRHPELERARSGFDLRHRLSVAYTYDLPCPRGRWSGLFRGWQSNGVWTFQTGRPLTVALLSDFDNSNTGRSALGFGAGDRPNRIADGRLDTRSPERWFDTGAFALPAYGTFGNSGRNILDGPGLAAINLSLLKNTMVGDNWSIQFRAEFFNLLNHTNFDLPDIFFGSPTFGRIQSAQAPRRIQFGLKLLF
jgi:hypothetical protein